MSQEYMVLVVDVEDEDGFDIDGSTATVFMRFTEEPPADFLARLAKENRGKRVYCLMGASSWFFEP